MSYTRSLFAHDYNCIALKSHEQQHDRVAPRFSFCFFFPLYHHRRRRRHRHYHHHHHHRLCRPHASATICSSSPRPLVIEFYHVSRSFYTFFFSSHSALFVVNVVLTWLFSSFFFGFVVALVLCVKPAPEQQRLDDAIGFLRDHAEVRIAEFQFFFPFPLFIRSFFLSLSLSLSVADSSGFSTSSSFLFCACRLPMPRPSRNSYARTRSLHFLLITLSVNR